MAVLSVIFWEMEAYNSRSAVAGTGGLEPPNDRVKVCCRNQLGYVPVYTCA